MAGQETEREQAEIDFVKFESIKQKLQQQAEQRGQRMQALAKTEPELIEKLSNAPMLEGSQFHTAIPRLALANFTKEESKLLPSINSDILFTYLRWAQNGWVPADAFYEASAGWSVQVEASRAEGSRWSKQAFEQHSRIEVGKEGENKGLFK